MRRTVHQLVTMFEAAASPAELLQHSVDGGGRTRNQGQVIRASSSDNGAGIGSSAGGGSSSSWQLEAAAVAALSSEVMFGASAAWRPPFFVNGSEWQPPFSPTGEAMRSKQEDEAALRLKQADVDTG